MAPSRANASRRRSVGTGRGEGRHRPLVWYRVALIAVIVVLGGVTMLFLRGPSAWQKRYYPLKYEASIVRAANRYRLNPYLISGVINAESGFDPTTKSRAGAVGLMQVLPSTAEELAHRKVVDAKKYPPSKLSDPDVNIEYGTAYLRQLIRRYHEVETALAAYNAGLRHADRWAEQGGNIREAIEFPETRHYVLRVMRGRDRYRALYPDAFPGWENQ